MNRCESISTSLDLFFSPVTPFQRLGFRPSSIATNFDLVFSALLLPLQSAMIDSSVSRQEVTSISLSLSRLAQKHETRRWRERIMVLQLNLSILRDVCLAKIDIPLS
jgi:hypothetical protein